MTTTDPIDDLLTTAGERWRAAQAPPPEPDVSRWVTPKRQGWLVPVGAAAATILAAGALVFTTHRTSPAPTLVPGNIAAGPTWLIVRDGDLVEVSGRVEGAKMCAPSPIAGESCPYGIQVPGIGSTDGATVRGRWHPGVLSDIQRLPHSPTTAGASMSTSDLLDTPPCPAPAGGWPVNDGGAPAAEDPLRTYLHAHADQFAEPFETRSGSARVLVVRVVNGDLDQARAALHAVYPTNLCVIAAPGGHSIADDDKLQATTGTAVAALMGDRAQGIYLAGPQDGKMLVNMVQLTQPLYDRLAAIGFDHLILDPWIRPAGR